MNKQVQGYWFMTWLGLLTNVTALPIIGILAFTGPPLQTANISLAFSIAWPAAIVGIVASSGLLAKKRWGILLAIISISMVISSSLPYSIVRSILVEDSLLVSSITLAIATINILALLYWCRPEHRKNKRL